MTGRLPPCAIGAATSLASGPVEEEVANYLNNKKRRELVALEAENNVEVQVVSKEGLSPEFLKIDCLDQNGREVRIADA